jgi:hypothetical protein
VDGNMVTDVSEQRLVMLFTEGLDEPLRGWVKYFMPSTLHGKIGWMRKHREN